MASTAISPRRTAPPMSTSGIGMQTSPTPTTYPARRTGVRWVPWLDSHVALHNPKEQGKQALRPSEMRPCQQSGGILWTVQVVEFLQICWLTK